jgi:hypothetical protein
MKIEPILVHGLDGRPREPIIKDDLEPLATEAALQALLTAVQALPRVTTKVHRVTISLANALANSAVALGTLTHVHAVTVADLTGAVVPTLKVNGIGETAVPLAKGEVRDGLDATTLHINCGAGGGTLVLELHGR